MIECHKNRLWYQEQAIKQAGITNNHKMTLIKLSDERLFIHSPIELTASLKAELEQLGTIAAIVTPNKNHHHFLSEWWLAYPDAYFFAAPGLQQTRGDLTFDDVLRQYTPALWQGQLLQTLIRGSDHFEEIAFCDPVSQTLILGDTLAWMIEQKHPLNLGYALFNGCYFSPAMPLLLRLSYTEKKYLRQSIQEILTWPFERIIFSKGKVVENNGKSIFADAFRWLFQQ
ncbi:methanol oxidase, glmU [Photobacterium leiognathi subsp. mandapamensis]|uniref:DUF4336 domain-containing protein n=1 Tax=Photobacterium leiognathi TaxID=553611 RepID=UPI000D163616|nr:DUF4336 domain-containing protein [Photobacterium leiognathi]PSV01308.1 methanol oxidase, glmU [Photobacterium leiognathi subsp. mandapamensis]